VFDTGNPVFSKDHCSDDPANTSQSAWEFYDHVKDHVAYIHIKDGYIDEEKGKMVFTHAGEGNGDVKKIVKHALDNGYDGGISMEPHLAVVFHDESVTSEDDVKYANYVEYGRRFMDLIREIGHGDKLT
jgi:sugar phosphate isomerase/epimerase